MTQINIPKDSGFVFFMDDKSYKFLKCGKDNIYTLKKEYLKQEIKISDIDYIQQSCRPSFLINIKDNNSEEYKLYRYDVEEYFNRPETVLLECKNPIHKVKTGIYYYNSDDEMTIFGVSEGYGHKVNFGKYFTKKQLKEISVQELERNVFDIALCLGNRDFIHGIVAYDRDSFEGFQMYSSLYIERDNKIEDLKTDQKLISPSLWCGLVKETNYYQQNKESIEFDKNLAKIYQRQRLNEIITRKRTET